MSRAAKHRITTWEAPVDEYVSDLELAAFYQILAVYPQLGAALYRPVYNEAFRAWLQDTFDDATASRQTWLEALYLYYGIADGIPKTYAEVGYLLGKSPTLVREQAARGLRYLWVLTRVRQADEGLPLLDADAAEVNGWITTDTSYARMFSLEGFLNVMDESGDLTGVESSHTDHRIPELWNPQYAEQLWPQLTEPDRVILKDGVPFSTG
jgi:hypothetical protein